MWQGRRSVCASGSRLKATLLLGGAGLGDLASWGCTTSGLAFLVGLGGLVPGLVCHWGCGLVHARGPGPGMGAFGALVELEAYSAGGEVVIIFCMWSLLLWSPLYRLGDPAEVEDELNLGVCCLMYSES